MTTYDVTATQLNRQNEQREVLDPFKRGDTFTESDVTDAELKRWLSLRPAVIADQDELQKASMTLSDAQQQIADLEAQLAELRASSAGAGAAVPDGLDLSKEPAKNAGRDKWAAWATAKVQAANGGTVPDEDSAFLSNQDNDAAAIRARYGSAGA